MKLSSYLKDKIISLIISLVILLFIILLLFAFKVPKEAVSVIIFLILISYLLFLLPDYIKRKLYYEDLLKKLDQLDNKYLLSEVITKTNFIDGKILYDIIYEIDKSMHEEVKKYEDNLVAFKDFVELWIHEVKIPLSGIYLMIHNSKNTDHKLVEQVKKLEDQVEQVLYYARCEASEEDYLIKNVNLKTLINKVALNNKEYFINHSVNLITDNLDELVLTDAKWLEFIVNQLVHNSLKYRRNDTDSYIKITSQKERDSLSLIIEDNGIGIVKSDLSKVFNKSFTGENGRKTSSSTGMGLYIVKNLCNKLGHTISVTSTKNEYTKVIITFNTKSIYDVVR